MKYLCLVYLDAAHWNACSDSVCADNVRQLAAGRHFVAGARRHSPKSSP